MNNKRISFHLYGSYHLGNSKGIMSSVLGRGEEQIPLSCCKPQYHRGAPGNMLMVLQTRVQGSLAVFGWYRVSIGCLSLLQASYDHVGKVKRIPGNLTQSPDFVEILNQHDLKDTCL